LSCNFGNGFLIGTYRRTTRTTDAFITSSLDDNGGHDLYHGSTFIKELENLVKNFEYTFDIEGKQIFPTNNIKQDIVSEYKSSEYNIDDLNYELLGFKIRASDIKIHVDPKKIDDTETRVDIPVLLAKDQSKQWWTS
jgi:hypothetical protein